MFFYLVNLKHNLENKIWHSLEQKVRIKITYGQFLKSFIDTVYNLTFFELMSTLELLVFFIYLFTF